MKTIIAGSRTIVDMAEVEAAIVESGFNITEIVSGGAMGVDTLGEMYAMEHGIPLKRILADWDNLGPAAGPVRNEHMAKYGDALILVWTGKTPGSRDMLGRARAHKLLVHQRLVV